VKQKEEGFRKTNETSELQTVTFQRKKLFRFLQTLACRTAGTFEDQKSASSNWCIFWLCESKASDMSISPWPNGVFDIAENFLNEAD